MTLFYVHGKGNGSDIKNCHRGVFYGTLLVRHSAPGPAAVFATGCDLIAGGSRPDGEAASWPQFFPSQIRRECRGFLQLRAALAHNKTPDFTNVLFHLHLYDYYSPSLPQSGALNGSGSA